MIAIHRRAFPFFLFTPLLLVLASGACFAQSAPVGQPDDTRKLDCLITNDFYAVHLTAYQVPAEVSSDAVKAGLGPIIITVPGFTQACETALPGFQKGIAFRLIKANSLWV